MFTRFSPPFALLCLFTAFQTSAAVHYVNVGSTNPVSPFSSWATAANAIQDAVDAASSGDQVLVTNGIYQTGGHKSLSGDITNRVNIPNAVAVQSVNGPTVTIIQGYQPVGASNASNAVRCAALGPDALLAGFTLTGGQAGTGNFINGGGVIGIFGAPPGVVSNCILTANIASPNGTGGGAYNATLVNCLLTSNRASLAGAAYNSTLINCTITGNSASNAVGGTYVGTLNNCIIYFNTAPSTSPANFSGGNLNNCCTFPLPGSGTGNITNTPVFVNPAGSDYHLQSNSPCINAGNNAYAPAGSDLDGNPRISGGTVDIGAYEFQNPASIISYAWLQQYGLPTDGSADFLDSDHDGLNNWQEWRTGTDPTNPSSVLKILPPSPSGGNFLVTWKSAPHINYYVQRASDLSAQPPFQTIATNLPGQAGTTSYTDTNAPAPGPYYYRVGVQ